MSISGVNPSGMHYPAPAPVNGATACAAVMLSALAELASLLSPK